MTTDVAHGTGQGSVGTSPIRVLVVDDDFYVASLHRSIVSSVPGFRVLATVGCAADARSTIATTDPDLVLLDLYLPDRSGLDLLTDIDVDALVVSAARDGESIRRALRRGAIDFLIKPFSAAQLVDRLNAYARFRNVLLEHELHGQEAVERALRIVHGSEAHGSAVRRSTTERSIVSELEAAPGGLSASAVAALIGVSRATAQRYLARLSATGDISVNLSYGCTGRPEHRYSVLLDAAQRHGA